ncbi:response regulator transcription factor [Planctobacterium marinum]|uniref:response regulator transcription factor n=1 Tax=Planctobacterium marinum TaxID=1631968 RepID=UPI001E327B37|nr:response regulator transcription factor [Planctobacterium marinum]MCC2605932.1 response regulator transcription factor [Planctobacterium marinum]
MTGQALSILLIEDNLALAKQICQLIESKGWQVDYAETGEQGIALALAHRFDVIVLDLNLPDLDGLQVCEHIKSQQTRITPVLMLTARDAFSDKAKGFLKGTDDYLTKPCDLRELAMRCEALGRRHQLHTNTHIMRGKLTLDTRAVTVSWDSIPLNVTKTGFKILKQLVQAHPYPVTRSDLIDEVWGNAPPESNSLKAHIYNVRKALEQGRQKQGEQPPELQTISNIGYRLVGLGEND